MTASWQTVVHVTQFERVDITAALDFMGRHADKAADQGGKLTITAVLMKVCAAALKRFPAFNASIDTANNRLILKKPLIHVRSLPALWMEAVSTNSKKTMHQPS